MKRYEVVFETAVYYSVFVDADDADEAADIAVENHWPPEFQVPSGFEIADGDSWFVEGVTRVRDED